MSSQSAGTPIVVTHEGGVRFAAQIRSHRLVVDQTARGGGEDSGPTPLELLGASLGTCVAFYVQQFCQARGFPYEEMRVEVDDRSVKHPSRIRSFTVRVILPVELPEPYGAMLERVARSCPAHNSLTYGAEVAVVIETAVLAASIA